MRGFAVCIGIRNKFANHNDERTQIFVTVMASIQHSLFDLLPKHLTDAMVKQYIFIGEMRVERGTVDARLFSNILHCQRLEPFLRKKSYKGLQDKVASACNTRVFLFVL